MRPLQQGWLPFLLLRTGGFHLAFSQPASSAEEDCETADSAISYEVQSFGAWYVWPCLSLFLAVFLLCLVAGCLQWRLKRQRLCSPPRTLAVFALSDVESVCENDATTWMPPKINLHLPVCEPVCSDSICDVAPPSYDEIMKPEPDLNSGPAQDLVGAALDLPQ